MDVDAVAVELYGLDPDQFTAARNERAQEARAAGANAASTRIKTLRKPTLAAWLTNLLVRTTPRLLRQLAGRPHRSSSMLAGRCRRPGEQLRSPLPTFLTLSLIHI